MNKLDSTIVRGAERYLGLPQTIKIKTKATSAYKEDLDLKIVVAHQNYQGPEKGKWVKIANTINEPGMDAHKCYGRFKRIKMDEKYYQPDILERVKQLAEMHLPAGEEKFAFAVSSMLSTEFHLTLSFVDCRKKYLKTLAMWSEIEETKLKDLITQYPSDWETISAQMGTKSPGQCLGKAHNLATQERKRKIDNPTLPGSKKIKI